MGPDQTSLSEPWQNNAQHHKWLLADALRQLAFFRKSLRPDGGFDVLGIDGTPLVAAAQELHTTTRLVHSYALGAVFGAPGCADMIDAGMRFLWTRHRDPDYGGYLWSVGIRRPRTGQNSRMVTYLYFLPARVHGWPGIQMPIGSSTTSAM